MGAHRYIAKHKKTVPTNHAKGGKGSGAGKGGAGGKVGGK